jgi:hypothetical protein
VTAGIGKEAASFFSLEEDIVVLRKQGPVEKGLTMQSQQSEQSAQQSQSRKNVSEKLVLALWGKSKRKTALRDLSNLDLAHVPWNFSGVTATLLQEIANNLLISSALPRPTASATPSPSSSEMPARRLQPFHRPMRLIVTPFVTTRARGSLSDYGRVIIGNMLMFISPYSQPPQSS